MEGCSLVSMSKKTQNSRNFHELGPEGMENHSKLSVTMTVISPAVLLSCDCYRSLYGPHRYSRHEKAPPPSLVPYESGLSRWASWTSPKPKASPSFKASTVFCCQWKRKERQHLINFHPLQTSPLMLIFHFCKTTAKKGLLRHVTSNKLCLALRTWRHHADGL